MRAATKERIYQIANEIFALVEAGEPNLLDWGKLAEIDVMVGRIYGKAEADGIEAFDEWVEEVFCKKYPNCK